MKSIVSLFDLTGTAVAPWVESGIRAYAVDIQHRPGIHLNTEKGLYEVGYDLLSTTCDEFLEWFSYRGHELRDISFTYAFPPCTHLAVSGARWFKGKGLRSLADSIMMFANASEICETLGAPYLIENPVSTISTYWRKPDHIFHPHFFTGYERNDNYTKKTCIWVGGGFRMPDSFTEEGLGDPDNRIHACSPGPDRANIRSATPMGFSMAVYLANRTPFTPPTPPATLRE